MPFNINEFLQSLTYGGTRPNQFQINIAFPTGLPGVTNQTTDMTFMAYAASIPGQDLGTIEVPYFGRNIKLAGDRTFSEWSIQVYNDEDFAIRDAFEAWSNGINSHVGNIRGSNAVEIAGYASNATIIQYGKDGTDIKEYEMIGCWPSNVSSIGLNWKDMNTIEEFSVVFQYQWWQARTTDAA